MNIRIDTMIDDRCQVISYLQHVLLYIYEKAKSVTTIKMIIFTYSIFSHFICVNFYKETLFKSINHYILLGKQELLIKIVNQSEISISFIVTFSTTLTLE